MYMQTLPALQNLKNVGEMVGDIGSFLNNIGKDIWSSYMNAVEQQNQGEYRTNRLYGLKLKINPTDYNNNTMFVALRLFYKRFNFYRDIFANGLKFVTQKSLKYHIINVNHGFDVDMRMIISQGSGKFGIALYKNIKKLVFQNVKLNNKFYKSISFSINDEDNLTMIVDGNTKIEGVSVKRPTVAQKSLSDYRLSGFTWLFADQYGQQYGIKKGFQLRVANSNGKFNGITNKFCTVDGDKLIFNKWDFSTNDGNSGGDYLFSDIKNFNNLKSIYNARVLQIEKEKKIQDECKKIVEKLKEALSQNDETAERKAKELVTLYEELQQIDFYSTTIEVHTGDYIFRSFDGKHRLRTMTEPMKKRISTASREELTKMIEQMNRLKEYTQEDTNYDGTFSTYHLNGDISKNVEHIILGTGDVVGVNYKQEFWNNES